MHSRIPETKMVPIKNLRIDPKFVSDDQIVKAYVNLEKGKIKAALTRIPTTSIYSGFYLREKDGSIQHVTNLRNQSVPAVAGMIRTGWRPTLNLLWSPHAPNGGGYVCADDETSLAAYRSLGILVVPCRVLRPVANLASEAAIWIEKKGGMISIAKTVPSNVENYDSVLGEQYSGIEQNVSKLIDITENTLVEIDKFHEKSRDDIHYHEMLHAVTRRHARALDSILRLHEIDRPEHAIAICRMAYEAFLNFHLDWIAPEFIGPRLQLISMLRTDLPASALKSNLDWRNLCNFPDIFENTSEKARLSPLGSHFHQVVYPPMSLVVHQTYQQVEFDASMSDALHSDEILFSEQQMIQCLDFLTAALLRRIRNEVGLS